MTTLCQDQWFSNWVADSPVGGEAQSNRRVHMYMERYGVKPMLNKPFQQIQMSAIKKVYEEKNSIALVVSRLLRVI